MLSNLTFIQRQPLVMKTKEVYTNIEQRKRQRNLYRSVTPEEKDTNSSKKTMYVSGDGYEGKLYKSTFDFKV
ncbi:hypothetical protein [Halalkalibacter urbisdiaboli]|uniref:hypothetical protein n=1 Tax=Halalkalibacter urbisdiaboli TaxID=1960589 RepID=UPI000B43BDD4|nr:hypothetical protein [Halalkalibacter urbisdiaboli]